MARKKRPRAARSKRGRRECGERLENATALVLEM